MHNASLADTTTVEHSAHSSVRGLEKAALIVCCAAALMATSACGPDERTRANFVEGYDYGWEGYCENLFHRGSKTWYYQDREFTYAWCLDLKPALNASDLPDEALQRAIGPALGHGSRFGFEKAHEAVFASTPALCHGEDCIDQYDDYNPFGD